MTPPRRKKTGEKFLYLGAGVIYDNALKAGAQRLHGSGTFATPPELREMYDKFGIEKGVLLPMINPECSAHLTTNEDAYELAGQYPDTLYWFCNIDPRMGCNSPASPSAKG